MLEVELECGVSSGFGAMESFDGYDSSCETPGGHEGTGLVRRRRPRRLGRLALVVSAVLGLILEVAAVCAYATSASALKSLSWAVSRSKDEDFASTTYMGLRSFARVDAYQGRHETTTETWSDCPADEARKLAALETELSSFAASTSAAARSVAGPQKGVSLSPSDSGVVERSSMSRKNHSPYGTLLKGDDHPEAGPLTRTVH